MSDNRPGRKTLAGITALAALWLVTWVQPCASALGAELPIVDKGAMNPIRDTTATLTLSLPPTKGKKLDVTVFYGQFDAGTEEADWEERRDIPWRSDAKEETKRPVPLEGLEPETKYYYCVRTTTSDDKTTWSTVGRFHTREWTLPWYGVLPIVLALLTLPFFFGGRLARRLRMPDYGWKIGLITCTLATGLVLVGFGWPPKLGIDLSGGVVLVYEVDKSEEKPGEKVDMDQLIAAISRRINPGGIKELTIRPYGVDQIEIIIPKVSEGEAERIEGKVSQAGTLEFRILANNHDDKLLIRLAREQRGNTVRDTEGDELGRWVPIEEGREKNFAGYSEIATRTSTRGDRQVSEILVRKDSFDVTGLYLDQASPDFDPKTAAPCVSFWFDAKGAAKFAALTGNNLPEGQFTRKLGIILDERLYSAPSIQSTISNRGVITGSFTQQEVKDLVDVLNAGALPTALAEEPISRLQMGPTLGWDTIRRGAWAIGVSMVLVLLFMMFYYRFAGFVACAALLVNLVLILAIMIAVKAAFTLPGLAGLVLTVGMAVDANVLIFERIREELARGAALRMAIRNGFARATTTIVDANLTTLITATVLYVIGTDQVRGFAVTLWLGVLLSMYTAIFCSRVVFDIAEKQRWLKELKMLRILKGTKIDFLGKQRLAAAVSIVVIVAGLIGVASRGEGLLDIDFTGGVSVEVLFDKPKDVAEVRKGLQELLPDLSASDAQAEGEERGKRHVLNTSLSLREEQKRAKSVVEAVERQLRLVFGPAGNTEQHKAAAERIQEQVDKAFAIDPETGRRKEAEAALRKQIKGLFAGATGASEADKRNAVEAVQARVEEALRGVTASDLVEQHLHDVFGDELAAMEVRDLEPIEGPGQPASAPADKKPAKPKKPATPAKPDAADQSRNDLPPDTVLARADLPSLLLAQAEPSDAEPAPSDSEETAEDTPEETPEEAPQEPPTETADAPPAESPAEPPTEPTAEPPTGPPTGSPTGPSTGPSTEPPTELPTEPPAGPPTEAVAEPPAGPPTEPPIESPAEPPVETPAEAPVEAPTGPSAQTIPDAAFAGGTRATLAFSLDVNHDALRAKFAEVFEARGSEPLFTLDNAEPDYYPGDDRAYSTWNVRIKLPPEEAQEVFDAIEANLEQVPLFPSSNTIGGTVAGHTRTLAITALVTSLLFIVGYIWIRFQRVVFGLAAVVALVHDVLITLGVIALSAYVATPLGFLLIDPFKIGLPVLAAFLTIIGYSLNDTIVVFDRIREVRGKAPQLTAEMVNTSINQTLSRTLLTSLTTLLVVLILYVGGGQGIHAFAFALVIGVIVGTYSSIFVASPVLLWMSRPPKSK